MSDDEILALFDEWNAALQTGDPKQVAALYEPDAILLPTVSNKVRHTPEEIEDYFVAFVANGPSGKIDEANVRHFGQIAINSGVYTFTFRDGSAVQARFTYVYRWTGRRWLITEHHSSRMPETATTV
ncbi:MAG: SgcJ/EcaC family oxidoreductase [Planctomycetota bacterium]